MNSASMQNRNRIPVLHKVLPNWLSFLCNNGIRFPFCIKSTKSFSLNSSTPWPASPVADSGNGSGANWHCGAPSPTAAPPLCRKSSKQPMTEGIEQRIGRFSKHLLRKAYPSIGSTCSISLHSLFQGFLGILQGRP